MKKGKLLEQIIKAIQEMVNDSKYTKVSSNALLKDKNGIMREIDVLVVCEQQHVKTSTALECKEYKRKVGITVVDALIGKYIDLPTINNKILIARNGFSEPAKEKAKANGITLCNIDEVINGDSIRIKCPNIGQIKYKINRITIETIYGNFQDVNLNEENNLVWGEYFHKTFFQPETENLHLLMASSYARNGCNPINYLYTITGDKDLFNNIESKVHIKRINYEITIDFPLKLPFMSKYSTLKQGCNNIDIAEFHFGDEYPSLYHFQSEKYSKYCYYNNEKLIDLYTLKCE